MTAAILLLLCGPVLGQEPLQALLDRVLGPGQAQVFVRTVQVQPVEQDEPALGPSLLWDGIRQRMDEAPSVLPGYRVPSSLKQEAVRSLKERAQPPPPAPASSVMQVTLVLDNAADERTLEKARELISQALSLDAERGDALRVVRADLASKETAPPRQQRAPPSRLPTRTALSVILGLAAGAVLLLAAAAFVRSLRSLKQVREPKPELPPPPPPPRLGLGHARAVAELLSGEPPSSAVEALRSAEPRVAADIFRRLPAALRRDVAGHLLAQSPPAAPGDFRERLRSALDHHDKGEGLLIEMLLRCPESERDEVLAGLDCAARLKEALLTMSDLAASDAASLRTCLAAFSSEDLALCLYELPDDVRGRILESLPEVFRSMVTDKLSYMVPNELSAVAMARGELYSRWRRLELCGRVKSLRVFAT